MIDCHQMQTIQTSAERYYEGNNNQENDPAFDLFSKLSVLIRIELNTQQRSIMPHTGVFIIHLFMVY